MKSRLQECPEGGHHEPMWDNHGVTCRYCRSLLERPRRSATRRVKPRLLDLFCGAGGAAMGYHRAGFDVLGVDINPQPNYPFDFVQADALSFLRGMAHGFSPFFFDAIHASPPCHDKSSLHALSGTDGTGWLLGATRDVLHEQAAPYVIENVVGADLIEPVRLCGSSFGLGVRRHRLFETSWPIGLVPPCAHHLQPQPIDVTGTGSLRIGARLDGGGGNSRKPRNIGEARGAMGIDWMSRRELSQAIPPAYTEWVGEQLIAHLESVAA